MREEKERISYEYDVAGMPEYLATVFATKDGPLGPPTGTEGQYRAMLTLSRPGQRPLPEREVTAGANIKGNSHFAIAKPAYAPPGHEDADELRFKLRTDGGEDFELRCTANEAGFLARAEVLDFDAKNLDDAHEKAYRAGALMLSNISVHLDIPLQVFQVDVTEVKTGTNRFSVINPYPDVPGLIDSPMKSGKDLRGYASVYREGLNSNNLLYQYLCLYKITEGIRKRRIALRREADRKGEKFSRPAEIVPSNPEDFEPWLNSIFAVRPRWNATHLDAIFRKEALGREFLDLIGDKKPMTQLRDTIGHAFTAASGKEVANLDEMDVHIQVHTWLPLLKCIARSMLKNEFPNEFLRALK